MKFLKIALMVALVLMPVLAGAKTIDPKDLTPMNPEVIAKIKDAVTSGSNLPSGDLVPVIKANSATIDGIEAKLHDVQYQIKKEPYSVSGMTTEIEYFIVSGQIAIWDNDKSEIDNDIRVMINDTKKLEMIPCDPVTNVFKSSTTKNSVVYSTTTAAFSCKLIPQQQIDVTFGGSSYEFDPSILSLQVVANRYFAKDGKDISIGQPLTDNPNLIKTTVVFPLQVLLTSTSVVEAVEAKEAVVEGTVQVVAQPEVYAGAAGEPADVVSGTEFKQPEVELGKEGQEEKGASTDGGFCALDPAAPFSAGVAALFVGLSGLVALRVRRK